MNKMNKFPLKMHIDRPTNVANEAEAKQHESKLAGQDEKTNQSQENFKTSLVYEPDGMPHFLLLKLVSATQLEHMLVKDLIYSFQGIDSSSIQKPAKDMEDFIKRNIDRTITKSKENLMRELLQVGQKYSFVNGFVQRSITKDDSRGLVAQVRISSQTECQSFVAAIQEHLKEFLRLLAVLETNLNTVNSTLTVRKLYVWMREPLATLQTIATLLKLTESKVL